jgi:hypothetical protein
LASTMAPSATSNGWWDPRGLPWRLACADGLNRNDDAALPGTPGRWVRLLLPASVYGSSCEHKCAMRKGAFDVVRVRERWRGKHEWCQTDTFFTYLRDQVAGGGALGALVGVGIRPFRVCGRVDGHVGAVRLVAGVPGLTRGGKRVSKSGGCGRGRGVSNGRHRVRPSAVTCTRK